MYLRSPTLKGNTNKSNPFCLSLLGGGHRPFCVEKVHYLGTNHEVLFKTPCSKSATSATTISVVKSISSRHGIPEVLRGDNGLQYSSKEFSDF